MSRPQHNPGFTSYKRDPVGQTDPSRGFTSVDELRRISKQRNADKRFNSPFGFHEPKYKKMNLISRYPKTFVWTFTTVCLLSFFGPPIYEAMTRQPTQRELERAHFLKKRMEAAGWWDNPFAAKSSSKKSD